MTTQKHSKQTNNLTNMQANKQTNKVTDERLG